jgi:cob(I)alamin adenosyltransferase
MKIYTRTGDKGQTSLFGGERVSKANERVSVYGTVDELNSALGLCAALCDDATFDAEEMRDWLLHVQKDLFAIGSWLASPKGKEGFTGARKDRTDLDDDRIAELEKDIDGWEAELKPLKTFILPGGGVLGASIHFARTICRRAERECVALADSVDNVPDLAVKYLNRLADALFVLARVANHREKCPETPWQ